MHDPAANVGSYLAALPAERRATLEAVRAVIRENLDAGFEEGMQYGMIGYYVPHKIFPPGYHTDPKEPLPFLGLASQKQNLALHLMHLYSDEDEALWFRSAWARSGKKLDMGKSCLRFRKLDDLALDVLAVALRRVTAEAYVERYQRLRAAPTTGRGARASSKSPPPVRQKPAAKPAPKQAASKKTTRKK